VESHRIDKTFDDNNTLVSQGPYSQNIHADAWSATYRESLISRPTSTRNISHHHIQLMIRARQQGQPGSNVRPGLRQAQSAAGASALATTPLVHRILTKKLKSLKAERIRIWSKARLQLVQS
jgi:hypothetical protein